MSILDTWRWADISVTVRICIKVQVFSDLLVAIVTSSRPSTVFASSPICLQELALKLILSLVTVTENVSQNTILEYLMIHPNLFDTVVKLLASPNLRVPHGYDALLLLTILVSINFNSLVLSDPSMSMRTCLGVIVSPFPGSISKVWVYESLHRQIVHLGWWSCASRTSSSCQLVFTWV